MDKGESGQAMEVTMSGQKFRVRSDADEAYVQSLASYVDHKLKEITKRSRTVTTQKAALLAALDIADEYFRTRERARTFRREVKRRTRRIADLMKE